MRLVSLFSFLENVRWNKLTQKSFPHIMKGTNISPIWVLKPLARCSFRLTRPPCAHHILSSWNPQLGLSKDTTKLAKSRIKVFVKQQTSKTCHQDLCDPCNLVEIVVTPAPLKYLVLRFKNPNVTLAKRSHCFVLFCNRYLFTLLDLLIFNTDS